jgi:hypothetical protein
MRARRWIAAGLVAIGLGLAGCSADAGTGTGVDTTADSTVQDIPGTDVKQVTLTEHAARRLGIKTVTVGGSVPLVARRGPAATASTAPRVTVVPYSAVIYAPDGSSWVYTVPRPLTYVRERVVVVVVRGAKGDEAVLSAAPPAGTTIVTTGVVELYGTELGIGNVEE